jgi:hypothetical protein
VLLVPTLQRWQDGDRRLLAESPDRRVVLERVRERVYLALRRRLGGSFSVTELVSLYDAGTSWCLPLAVEAAPDTPWAWDASVADAAFYRYVREASDWAGGRVVDG